jgi:ligand-binding sensor domain-containing protein
MGGINGPALSVSLDLFAPGTIYVGGNNRVLVSENKGDTWRELGTGLGSGPVTSLAKAGSTVFAAVFDSGVFRLDGESWRRVESIPSAGLNVVASALTEPRAVMVGTALDGLFRSTDGGTTWSQAERGLSLFIRGLAADGTTLYAGALAGGMFRSDDGGARWRNVGLRDRNIFVVQPDPANPSTVYAGTSLGVSRSTDRGANWAQITQRTASIRSIAVDPRDRNVVYVGGPAGRIDRSADGGRSWTIVNQGIPSSPVVALAVDSVDGSVYAAVERLGVYRSRNRGSDWERVSEIGDIVVLVASPRAGVLYAGSATEGVYQVDEQGRWNSFAGNLPNREVSALAIDFASPAVLLAATRSGVFRTTDGRTWSAAGRETGDTVSDLAADPSRPGRIYAATPRGLFATQDGGGRWSPVAGLPARGFVAVAVDPRGQGVAAAAADGGVWASTDGSAWRVSAEGVALGERGLVFGPSARDVFGGSVGQGIIRTTDGGASWEVNAPEATSEVACLALVVNPRNPQVIYAGAVGSGVIKTSNGGRTWQVANSGLAGRQVLSMVIDPDDPEVVYVGTVEGGVYITRNGAGTWSPLGDGIARRTVTSLLLDTRSGRNLWAGTEGGGVYRFRQPR